MDEQPQLSRRERQIMDIVYACGEATVTAVVNAMADPPSRTAVRTLMRILEEKGYTGCVSIELEDANFNGSTEGEKLGILQGACFLKGC